MSHNEKKMIQALKAFKSGEILVVTDHERRENEGDLIVAGVHCTQEKMGFIIRYTSGVVCVPLTEKRARDLELAPMVLENNSLHQTAFTVSVDCKEGTTTGISAYDRTLTVRKLVDSSTQSSDFVRPGHIFPLIAHEKGVMMRKGHTEAAVDLCKLTDLPPVAVICELMEDDGSVMKGQSIFSFAQNNALKIISIEDLIQWRTTNACI